MKKLGADAPRARTPYSLQASEPYGWIVPDTNVVLHQFDARGPRPERRALSNHPRITVPEFPHVFHAQSQEDFRAAAKKKKSGAGGRRSHKTNGFSSGIFRGERERD